MPSIKEINELFKAGRYDEAYSLALNDWQCNPDNVWEQRKMGWALSFIMKKDVEEGDFQSFINHLQLLSSLALLESEGADNKIFDVITWRLGQFPYNEFQRSDLFVHLRQMSFGPSTGYSFLLRAFLKNKEWSQLGEFMEWWNFEKFLPEDYEPFITEEGRRVMPLAEQAYIAYARYLLSRHDIQRIREFEPKLEKLADEYPRMTYPGYFCGKLLLAMDAETSEMLEEVLPFVRRKASEFWVWQMLAEIFDEDADKELACLLRAVHCRAQESFLGKVRIALVKNYLKRNDYARAKFHLDKVVRCYLDNGWRFPFEWSLLMNGNWMENVSPEARDNIDYMGITNSIAGLQTQPKAETKTLKGKVTANKAKTAFFVSDGKMYAFIPPQIASKVREGDAVTAKIIPALDKKTGKMGWKCIDIKK